MLAGEDIRGGCPAQVDATNTQRRNGGAHQQGRQALVVATRGAGDIGGIVKQDGKLLGLVEIDCVLAGEDQQLVEMTDIVVAAVRLGVVQPRGLDQLRDREQPHAPSRLLRIFRNTSWNISTVSRPVFVL
ncbi:MAG: hypothetical protein NTV97_09085 [Alphaproteobacteria bacterium]|nr:hypothetical protein [Alphaproteobacteria bacterium]